MGVSTYPEVAIEPGMIMPSARPDAPAGWLLCDGAYILRADYPALFAAISTTYNIAGDTDATRFRLPNLKGKVIVGFNAAETEFDALGESGGSKTSTATHSHTLSAHTHTQAHTHTFTSGRTNTNHAHNVYARDQTTGDGGSHFHIARFVRVVYSTTSSSHAHGGGANTAAEGQNGGVYYGANMTIDVDSSGNHGHNFNHDHPSTNWASESPWPGDYNHLHSGTTDGVGTPSTGGPSATDTGGSSAGAASGNLQPYLTMNYLIKT